MRRKLGKEGELNYPEVFSGRMKERGDELVMGVNCTEMNMLSHDLVFS